MKKLLCLCAFLLVGCGTYQYVPNTVYIDAQTSPENITSVFTGFDTNIIYIKFKPFRPSFYFNNNYGYWGIRPLWLDFNFYHGDFYSYYSSFYRPWNYWDYYMRPWHYGPYNNPGYNVVHISSRRKSINKITRKRQITIKPLAIARLKPINVKPTWNNKPRYNSKPRFNNKPSSKPSYSKPSYSKPSYNSKPSTNSVSTRKKGKNN